MIIKYETFEEIDIGLTDGASLFHRITYKHDEDCLAWQKGIHDFAKWLTDNNFIVKEKE